MTCEEIQRRLPFVSYSELSFDEEEQLHQHIEACASCRADFEKLKEMHQTLDRAELDPDPVLLTDCRRSLRIKVAALAESDLSKSSLSLFGRAWFSRLLPSFPTTPLRSLGAVALIAVGFFSARLIEPGVSSSFPLVGRSSFEPVASRVRYVEPDGSGRVEIIVEETRERVLTGNLQDEPIRTLLLAAARESVDPGVRVETMGLLNSQAQTSEVRHALLQALQHDPNAGVRLKALEGLRTVDEDPEIRNILTHVLLTDTNPGVRTQAVDLLTKRREPSLAGVLQELMTKEDNNYVRLKCQKALREMNASVETF
jgi:hypothetical protein